MEKQIKTQNTLENLFPNFDRSKKTYLESLLKKEWTGEDIKESLLNQLGL